MPDLKITILTATLNASEVLPRVITSLRSQTDTDFEWVIADGGSTDGSQALVGSATDLQVRVTEAPDFGIYDALNRGLRLISGGYYLVVGADDTLQPDAIENFRRAALKARQPDFVAAGIKQDGKVSMPKKRLGWLFGIQGVASSHAVGLLIKRDLHSRYGFYSNKLPIAADQLFVRTALKGGATVEHGAFISGEFSTQGVSGSDPVGVLTEVFRSQLRTERYLLPQYLLLFLRLTKFYLKSVLSRSPRK